jgi:hypothetical protein
MKDRRPQNLPFAVEVALAAQITPLIDHSFAQ